MHAYPRLTRLVRVHTVFSEPAPGSPTGVSAVEADAPFGDRAVLVADGRGESTDPNRRTG